MKVKKNKIKIAILIVSLSVFAYIFFLEDQFSLKNVTFNEATFYESPTSVVELKSEGIDSILNQTFTYLGKGHQSYAFLSQDQRYVLKFFKFTYLKSSKFNNLISSLPILRNYYHEQKNKKEKKIKMVFNGYRLAFDKDQHHTGVFYIHLAKTNNLKKAVTLQDRFGFTHHIDLDSTFFVLQHKAETTKKVFKELLDQHDLDAFKQRMGQLLNLYVSEYKQGIFDKDHNVLSNTGFLKDNAIRIDVGRLSFRPEMQNPSLYLLDLKKIISKRIYKWLKTSYPEDYDELLQDIEGKLFSL
jgi:hypothetical protein